MKAGDTLPPYQVLFTIAEGYDVHSEIVTIHPPTRSRTIAPSPEVFAMRAFITTPDFESASSINSQVIPVSDTFARLDQQESACPA